MAESRLPFPKYADTLSLKALRSLVIGALERTEWAEVRLEKREAETRPFVKKTQRFAWKAPV